MKKILLLIMGLLISSSLHAAPYIFVEGGYGDLPAGTGGEETFLIPVQNNDPNAFNEKFFSPTGGATPLLAGGIGWVTLKSSGFIADNRIELEYNQVLPWKTSGTRYQTNLQNNATEGQAYEYTVTSSQFFVNDVLEFGALLPNVHPFIGGGAGFAVNTASNYEESEAVAGGGDDVFSKKSMMNFLYTATVGIAIHTPYSPWGFYVGYRYIHGGMADTSSYDPPEDIVPNKTSSSIVLSTPININEAYFRIMYQL